MPGRTKTQRGLKNAPTNDHGPTEGQFDHERELILSKLVDYIKNNIDNELASSSDILISDKIGAFKKEFYEYIYVMISRGASGGLQDSQPQKAPDIDLEREVLSRGREAAEDIAVNLIAKLVVSSPERQEVFTSRVVRALERKAASLSLDPPKHQETTSKSAHLPKMAKAVQQRKAPSRTGHPLIEDFALLWDQRESLSRDQFVKKFQNLLDDFYLKKSLGGFKNNNTACRWANTIARTERIRMFIEINEAKYEELTSKKIDTGSADVQEPVTIRPLVKIAVTIECEDNGRTGSFSPRMARRPPTRVTGYSSPEFPKISTVPL